MRGCIELGIDITKEPIPVVPAQHYTCGGVVIDMDGRSDLPGLYAIGEVSQSGLHGANRLASNSLLECFVFGDAAATHIAAQWDDLPPPPPIRAWDESRVTDSDEEVVIKQNWTEIRRFMWNYVGIVRTTKRLERARHRIQLLTTEIEDYYGHFRVTPDLVELATCSRPPSSSSAPRSIARRAAGSTTRWIIQRRWPRRWIRCWRRERGEGNETPS